MAPRANWKGILKIGEVSCPVGLFTAAFTVERIAFHILNRKTGHRVHREFVDAETGERVEAKDQVRGYEPASASHGFPFTSTATPCSAQAPSTRSISRSYPGRRSSWRPVMWPMIVTNGLEKRAASARFASRDIHLAPAGIVINAVNKVTADSLLRTSLRISGPPGFDLLALGASHIRGSGL